MGASRKNAAQRKTTQQEQTRALQTRREQVATVRDLVERYEDKFRKVLPTIITPERMIEVTMTEIGRNPELLKCTQASLIGCVIQSAQLGLLPGITGEAHLVPFRNTKRKVIECTLIIGYKGLLKLAYNSGEIAAVTCEVVYERDQFEYQFGTNGFVHHKPSESEDRGKMTHAYAIIFIKGSTVPTWTVFPRAKIMQAKRASRAAASGQSPWQTHEDEMWCKTVLRHICKRLPSSIERVAQAVALDERADAGISQGLRVLAPELPEVPAGGHTQIDVSREGQVPPPRDDEDVDPEGLDAEDGGEFDEEQS